MPQLFSNFPDTPASQECQNAFVILRNAHKSASSFLDIFNSTRRARGARGTPTDEEQDLLRAMLLFATAGLDSMVKQLVRDALPKAIETNEGAKAKLKDFMARRLRRRGDELDYDWLADVIVDESPRGRVVNELVADLTSGSLQSGEQLLRVAAYFDIPSISIAENIEKLKNIFDVRNEIAHEMDVDFSQPNRNRRPRARGQIVSDTNEVFRVANNFLLEVSARLT